MTQSEITCDARRRLIEAGGRISQDLGMGRILGQILVYLYLQEQECSLDAIGADLGLSKAAVSIAIRQLENLGLVRRAWKKGDRKNYYRSAENIAAALQQGLMAFIRQKMQTVGTELDHVNEMLDAAAVRPDADADLKFLHGRVKRAKTLRDRAGKVIDSPIFRFFVKS